MQLLSCQNVKMGYDGRLAVDDVSFTLDAGDYLYIVGENGSGKSTLAKGILGLSRPVGGRIAFHGVRQTEIGYLPQQTVVQKDFPASVFEVVLSGCLNRRGLAPFYTRREKERASGNMARLGIGDLVRKSYRDLSGGQQQRVLLARALCAAEKLLLLDEPVAGLDPVMTAELYGIIRRLNREQGMTVIMISHDIGSAVQHGGKILHMQTRAAFFGDAESYRGTELCRRMMGGAGND
jgi:zinc transport system ATP-binding protein